MLRRRRSGAPPAAARPAASSASSALAEHLPAAGKIVSVGFVDVSVSWRTRVEQVAGSSLEVVAPTRSMGEAIVPEVGREVIVGWAAEDGYFEAESSFAATGVDTVVSWVLQVRRLARLQRRTAFRIDASGPVTLHLDGREVAARLRNISEGGLCCTVASVHAPEDGTALEVSTDLEELGSVTSQAEVVRVSPTTEPREVELGIGFVGLDDTTIESLRQFVFAEQLRRRRLQAPR